MTQNDLQNTAIQNGTHDDSNDIKKIIFKILRNWYWFVLCVFICTAIAYAYNRYTTPIYSVKTSIMLNDVYTSSPFTREGGGPSNNIFSGLGATSSMRNISSQMEIIKSTSIISKTIESLDFEVSYYSVGRVAVTESYQQVPFRVIWDKNHPQLIETDFFLTLKPDGKLLINVEKEDADVYNYATEEYVKKIPEVSFTKVIEPGTQLVADEFSFTILLDEPFNPIKEQAEPGTDKNYKFRFDTRASLVERYKESLYVELSDNSNNYNFASIVELSIQDYNIQKGADFLNKLTEVYTVDNLEKKNDNANRTIQFINSQLDKVSDSLNTSENSMQNFQSRNQVLNISTQSDQLLQQMNDLDKEKVALETKNKYYHYLQDYIEGNQEMGTVIAPSAMGIEDPLLNSLILQLNELITEKSSQTSIRPDSKHPAIVRLNAQIESVKRSLLENTSNIIKQSDIALEDLNERIRGFEARVRRLPGTERNYVNLERKYNLNNENYNFLLQKLSEAQIAKASNSADSQVIEEAYYGVQVKPQGIRIYAIALLMGLAIPALFIFLLDFFNNKIISKDEIEALTSFPILGHIFHNEKEYGSHTVVLDKPNSPASEPFRAIRNKLFLMTKGKEHPVIAVSSSLPGEGKSYNAVNIATTFALMRKKTVVLDLDLRNSKMAEYLLMTSDKGVVDYIIGKASLEEIIFDTKHPNLKIISAGPIPPNPAEMLTDKKMLILLKQLKELFDVIIIDTAPVGFITDLFQLHEIIDTNLLIVRHKYTHKQALKDALDEMSKHGLKGVGIIVNDIRILRRNYGFGNSYGYGYGYGYGYAYGYGYGQKDGKNNKRKKLKVENTDTDINNG